MAARCTSSSPAACIHDAPLCQALSSLKGPSPLLVSEPLISVAFVQAFLLKMEMEMIHL